MLRIVDSDFDFCVTNTGVSGLQEILQAIVYLLRVKSPFVKNDFSLDDYIGSSDINEVKRELADLLPGVYGKIRSNYNVLNIDTLYIRESDDDSGFVEIGIQVKTPTDIYQGVIYA